MPLLELQVAKRLHALAHCDKYSIFGAFQAGERAAEGSGGDSEADEGATARAAQRWSPATDPPVLWPVQRRQSPFAREGCASGRHPCTASWQPLFWYA